MTGRADLVSRIFHAAIARAPEGRLPFVAEACEGDEALRREVESLLGLDGVAAGFLERPAAAALASEIRAAGLAGARLGKYAIGALIGAGGMAEVYRARDVDLSRDVAIKVLPPRFADDPDRLVRFEREARLLASLNHPRIATIHGFERIDSRLFLVLELVEGQTLAERLETGPIGVEAALNLARQIAEALEAAHEHGIIHRDLKPTNVKITAQGSVKLLDFGVAKALVPAAAGAERDSGISASGLILGTAAYMSPEQARGQAVDRRTDNWAFGCVLYELLTGRAPFQGDSASDIVAAVLTREPDWSALPKSTPATIRLLLRRCLEKRPERRLREIADARLEIEQTLESTFDRRREPTATGRAMAVRPATWAWWMLLASVLLAGYVGWKVWGAPQAGEPIRLVPLTTFPGAARPGQSTRTLAVLPLKDVSPDPSHEYVADGMTQALNDTFSTLGIAEVVSATSSGRYRHTSLSSSAIARELGADVLVEGAVLRSGERLRISVALVDGQSGRRVWSNVYERTRADVLTLYDDIAFTVAEELKTAIGANAPGRRRPVDPAAYDEYLRGMYFLSNRWMAGGCVDAERALIAAINRDPDFAPAYAALAWCYAFPDRLGRDIADIGPKARAAVAKALALDDRLALAHAVAGVMQWRIDYDSGGGALELQRALELDPNSALVLIPAAESLLWRGNPDRGRLLLDRAIRLDPFSAERHVSVGFVRMMVGENERAIHHFRTALELDAHSMTARLWVTEALAYSGRRDEAVEDYLKWIDGAARPERAAAARAAAQEAYARRGWEGFWRRDLELAEEEAAHPGSVLNPPYTRYSGPWYMARRYARLGEQDRALKAIEQAVASRHHLVATLALEPLFVSLRSRPGFRDLLKRTGAVAAAN
jgi:TolB-like protein